MSSPFGFGPRFEAGQFIRFNYRGFQTVEPDKEVMVLHPNWRGQLHGIDLKRLTPAQVDVLHQIMDPETKTKGSRVSLVNDILRRMDPVEEIKSPMTFYVKMVKPFLRGVDAYRRYETSRMSGVTILRESQVKGTVTNVAPLFKKPF